MKNYILFSLLFISSIVFSQDTITHIEIKRDTLDYSNTSMIQLLSNPQKFNNKPICVSGFINFDFECNALYNNQDDYVYSIYKNGVRIYIPNDIKEKYNINTFTNRYVEILGIFKVSYSDYYNIYSGWLTDICFIQIIEPKKIWQSYNITDKDNNDKEE